MTARNRGGYSNYSARRSNARSVFRTLFVMLALGAASFAFGFGVLARLLPASEKANNASSPSPVSASDAQNNGATDRNAPASGAVRARTSPPPMTAPPANTPPPRTNATIPGPTIDPEDDGSVQKPDNPDSPKPNEPDPATLNNSPAPTTAPEDPGKTSDRATRRKRHKKADTDGIQNPAGVENNPVGGASRTSTAPNTAQPPASPDGNGAAVTPRLPETSATPGSGLYRVTIGVFSTQSAADEQARQAQEKGFSTTLHKIMRDGRLLYRVQEGVYSNRSNAEAARKRLSDSGIEANISGP